jgi:hypothetical protein
MKMKKNCITSSFPFYRSYRLLFCWFVPINNIKAYLRIDLNISNEILSSCSFVFQNEINVINNRVPHNAHIWICTASCVWFITFTRIRRIIVVSWCQRSIWRDQPFNAFVKQNEYYGDGQYMIKIFARERQIFGEHFARSRASADGNCPCGLFTRY